MNNVAYNDAGDGTLKLVSMKTYPEKMQVIMDEAVVANGTDGTAKAADKQAEANSVVIIEEEIPADKEQATEPYPDMGKDDLLRFSETTFWRRARLISILLFWLLWLALLGTVIGLTIVAPRCGDPPQPQWWQKSVFYQIYVRSFYDSDNNGIGDIPGIVDKLDYIRDLGVDAILISSVYESDAESSGMADYGYQVIDHKAIDRIYGTMDDLDDLIRRSHENNISVILDFIPNYTSKQHSWFQSSSASDAYTNAFWNYYVWAKDAPSPPNLWTSVYGPSAWTTSSGTRTGHYLHQFLDTQPELNLRSKSVQDELNTILEFWMNKGVDGFRVVSSAYLFESQDLADNPTCASGDDTCRPYENTQSQLEVYDMVARWRSTLDKFQNATYRGRTLLTDGDVPTTEAMNYYGTFGRGGANLPINYQLTQINSTCDNLCISNLVYGWLDLMPSDATADWLTGDQNRPRLMSNVGEELAVAVNMIKMTLPGSAIIYYGEEIGMTNGVDAGKDAAGGIDPKYSRDGFRSPMQWTGDNATAGFTNSTTPWIPIANGTDLSRFNVESQSEDENSILNKFRSLSKLRRDEASLQFGKLHKINTAAVFAFVREHEGFSRILVVGCFGSGSVSCGVDLTTNGLSDIDIPSNADVLFSTNSSMPYQAGGTIDLWSVSLSPGHGFVAAWDYKRP